MAGEIFKVKCLGLNEEGKGIIKIKGREYFVSYLIPGEFAKVELERRGKFSVVRLVKIETVSKERVKPPCIYYNSCGGCQLQHLRYEAQLDFKEKYVSGLLSRFCSVGSVVGMKNPWHYRNKVHSALTYDSSGKVCSGIYAEGSHRVVPIDFCLIQDRMADDIIASVISLMGRFKLRPYDEDKRRGFLRHVLVKRGFGTGEVMVVLVGASRIFPGKSDFVKALLVKHPEITTVVFNVNEKKTSMVLGESERVLFGRGFIEDVLCGCVFRISPKSFYQVNPVQTEVLYAKAVEMAGLSGREFVLDAYCGVGTIGLVASRLAGEVVGIELNGDAVRDAVENAKRNGVGNVRFIRADAGDFMVDLAGKGRVVDVVFVDPPRSGCDLKFLSSLIRLEPKRVVYVSCSPVTLARDVDVLVNGGYVVREVVPVDMFPQTFHVETVVLLEKK